MSADHCAPERYIDERKATEQLRFHRSERLLGSQTMAQLKGQHAMVIGVGGVGSWAAEMLVRSGVGRVTLVDFDEICVTNTNRQSHALKGNIGKTKVGAMAERMRLIAPEAQVEPLHRFYNHESAEGIFALAPDIVLDCIDNITAKCHLIASGLKKGTLVLSAMGAAARLDATQLRVGGLEETRIDPMAKMVRKILRKGYGVESGSRAVYSIEPPNEPQSTKTRWDDVCVCPGGAERELHTCDHRNVILGSVGFVTGAMGMAMAGEAVRMLGEVGA